MRYADRTFWTKKRQTHVKSISSEYFQRQKVSKVSKTPSDLAEIIFATG